MRPDFGHALEFVATVPPHPNPLPWERGSPFAVQRKSARGCKAECSEYAEPAGARGQTSPYRNLQFSKNGNFRSITDHLYRYFVVYASENLRKSNAVCRFNTSMAFRSSRPRSQRGMTGVTMRMWKRLLSM